MVKGRYNIMSEKVRVMRILVYEGTREWVENTLNKSYVPLEGTQIYGGNCIKSTLVDKFPEIIERKEEN